jgi:hypothetical protein
MPGQLSDVVVVNGPQGPHDRQVVGTLADMGDPVADFEPTLAVTA